MQTNHAVNPRPSSAYNPDLDWSQVRETIGLVCLAVVQIETSLKESTTSMEQLTDNFTHIAMEASRINNNAEKDTDESRKAILDSTKVIHEKVTDSITSFQFYDRITQRLEHVTQGLLNMNDLIGDQSCLYNPTAWCNIQENIKNSYSMECERFMFDKIMQGATIKEAMDAYSKNIEEQTNQDSRNEENDIELF